MIKCYIQLNYQKIRDVYEKERDYKDAIYQDESITFAFIVLLAINVFTKPLCRNLYNKKNGSLTIKPDQFSG